MIDFTYLRQPLIFDKLEIYEKLNQRKRENARPKEIGQSILPARVFDESEG